MLQCNSQDDVENRPGALRKELPENAVCRVDFGNVVPLKKKIRGIMQRRKRERE
jgi:hypothetical protein